MLLTDSSNTAMALHIAILFYTVLSCRYRSVEPRRQNLIDTISFLGGGIAKQLAA